MLFTVVVPLVFVIVTTNLLIGLGLSAVIWGIFIVVRNRVRKAIHYAPPPPLASLEVMGDEQQAAMMRRARLAGFWFATIFAVVSLVVDLIYFLSGALPTLLMVWVVLRTLLLPVAGYALGSLGGRLALQKVVKPHEGIEITVAADEEVKKRGGWFGNGFKGKVSKQQQLKSLSQARASEEAKEVVPNDRPLQSRGASRFYILLLLAFVVLYPVLDPLLFGSGTQARITSYGDLGYYVILALGLNIVVGFAGLLDLGYVAFFVIGTYAWAMVGSSRFTTLTGFVFNPTTWPWLFWPMLIISALVAAFWGVVLGAPTLRLRGDYLAIVTLGFGEIVPIIFLRMSYYTGGSNGIVGIFPPQLCLGSACVNWNTPTPFYYLILILIVLSVFANIRLRDSRLGRAWVAIREDEIAASSSGINLVNTKLFAFAAGAFFAGVAGAFHAAKLGAVSPDNFSSQDSFIFLAMVVIGGLGSIPGVIVGAVVVYAVNILVLAQLDTFATDPNNILHIFTHIPNFAFSNIRNLLFGLVLIVIMIFRPEGLIPSARRKRELHHSTSGDEQVELSALDEPPGSPGLETEMRVE
jgi:ABC-type branched-subunit amino acid transport system permease subunit